MNKVADTVIALVVSLCCAFVVIADGTASEKKQVQRLNLGGRIAKPGSQQGRIVIYDTQKAFADRDIKDVILKLKKPNCYQFEITKGDAEMSPIIAMKKHSANVLIKIIDVSGQPAIAVAPEEHWCVLNVHALRDGLVNDAVSNPIFQSRCRKELIRAFAFACGGILSQYPNNITCVSSIRGLDAATEELPVDVRDRVKRYLESIGVTPAQFSAYYFACQQGWAPKPTNDVQKAIWEKVLASPKNPMKIEFDPMKGR